MQPSIGVRIKRVSSIRTHPNAAAINAQRATSKRTGYAVIVTLARMVYKKKLRTEIRCVETGEIFPSQAAAARWAQIHKYGINNVLMGK